jgi:predicted nucleotidyltransferase
MIASADEINLPMESSRIALSSLSPRYELALRAASVYVFSEFDPFAVVVSGSFVRGNPDSASDFDIIVIHRHSWRRRVQKWFEGIPTEIFVNSPEWIESYLKQESAEGRPVMAHMLTTGVLAYSSLPQTDSILEHEREPQTWRAILRSSTRTAALWSRMSV